MSDFEKLARKAQARAAAAASSGDTSNVTALLNSRGGNSARVATAIAGASVAMSVGRSVWSKYVDLRNERRYTVSIDADDEIYTVVQSWVLGQMNSHQKKALMARTIRRGDISGNALARLRARLENSGRHTALRRRDAIDLLLYYDGSRAQKIDVDGYRVEVAIERFEGESGGGDGSSKVAGVSMKAPRIVFHTQTVAARDAVLNVLRSVAKDYESERNSNRLYTANKWGDWVSAVGIPPRALDTVILAKGAIDDLVLDLTTFLASEERYAALGLPWHRGYLLHGPPGTGKTSVVKAIANEMQLDTYYMPLSDLNKDTDLNGLVSSINPGGVLLLEDIDVVHGTRERDDSGDGITAAGLLNALDGVITPHGLITIMTTNKLEVLDSALIRPGRADRIVEISYMDQDQFRRMCELIVGRSVDNEEIPDITGYEEFLAERKQLAPAQVLEWAKGDLADPERALKIVIDEVGGLLKEAEIAQKA